MSDAERFRELEAKYKADMKRSWRSLTDEVEDLSKTIRTGPLDRRFFMVARLTLLCQVMALKDLKERGLAPDYR